MIVAHVRIGKVANRPAFGAHDAVALGRLDDRVLPAAHAGEHGLLGIDVGLRLLLGDEHGDGQLGGHGAELGREVDLLAQGAIGLAHLVQRMVFGLGSLGELLVGQRDLDHLLLDRDLVAGQGVHVLLVVAHIARDHVLVLTVVRNDAQLLAVEVERHHDSVGVVRRNALAELRGLPLDLRVLGELLLVGLGLAGTPRVGLTLVVRRVDAAGLPVDEVGVLRVVEAAPGLDHLHELEPLQDRLLLVIGISEGILHGKHVALGVAL